MFVTASGFMCFAWTGLFVTEVLEKGHQHDERKISKTGDEGSEG